MRPQMDRRPQFRLGRGRVVVIGAVLLGFVLLASLRSIASLYTDVLWFRQLGAGAVWRGVIGTKLRLGIGATLLFVIAAYLSLWVAERFSPTEHAMTPDAEVIDRYHEAVGNKSWLVRLAVAALFGVVIGPTMASRWNEWLLYRNGGSFAGPKDPQFGKNAGFYVFKLPFLSSLASWAFTALLLLTVLSALGHYLYGGIRMFGAQLHVSAGARAHVSVMLALLALARLAGYVLDRYRLVLATDGYVHGAGYTDVHFRLPALTLLCWIALTSVVLFIVNLRMNGWAVPVLAMSLWAIVSLAVGEAFPRIMQAVNVSPNERTKERKYIERNIAATRFAYGVEGIKQQSFSVSGKELTSQNAATDLTVQNVRLWDPTTEVTGAAFGPEKVKEYFSVENVDIDRYVVDGVVTPVVMAVRELNTDASEVKSWVNRHLQYTHGIGIVAAAANSASANGRPTLIANGLPPVGKLPLTEPRVYVGDGLRSFAIAATETDEVDYPTAEEKPQSSYKGSGGVQMSSLVHRVAFALRFGDPNLVLSSQIKGRSKLFFVRDVGQRARKLAPFLRFDADPYPVVIEGRIVWVLDAFATSNHYPYSQHAPTGRLQKSGLLSGNSGLTDPFNYVRNSVKVVVDAYTGATSFYVVDTADPITRAYRKAFPKLLKPSSSIEKDYPGLTAHLRYPRDLLAVQGDLYANYHVTSAELLYSRLDAWATSPDPNTGTSTRAVTTVTVAERSGTPVQDAFDAGGGIAMRPEYVLVQLPGDKDLSFVVAQNLVSGTERKGVLNLSSIVLGRSGPGGVGELRALVVPRDARVPGPSQIGSNFESDPALSERLSLLNQQGSKVIRGALQVLPVGNSLLYVRPLYVRAETAEFPELKFVALSLGESVAFDTSFAGALKKLIAGQTLSGGSAASTTTVPGSVAGGSTPTTVSGSASVSTLPGSVLDQAAAAYEQAQTALRAGDLATYQRKVDEVGQLIAQARSAESSPSTTAPSTTAPSTTVAPANSN